MLLLTKTLEQRLPTGASGRPGALFWDCNGVRDLHPLGQGWVNLFTITNGVGAGGESALPKVLIYRKSWNTRAHLLCHVCSHCVMNETDCRNTSEFDLFWRSPQKTSYWWQGWGNSSNNPSHPQKFGCSYTYYYHGSYELWNIAGRPQKLNFILKFYLYFPEESKDRKLSRSERDFSWPTVCLRVRLSWGFVLTWCCLLTKFAESEAFGRSGISKNTSWIFLSDSESPIE